MPPELAAERLGLTFEADAPRKATVESDILQTRAGDQRRPAEGSGLRRAVEWSPLGGPNCEPEAHRSGPSRGFSPTGDGFNSGGATSMESEARHPMRQTAR